MKPCGIGIIGWNAACCPPCIGIRAAAAAAAAAAAGPPNAIWRLCMRDSCSDCSFSLLTRYIGSMRRDDGSGKALWTPACSRSAAKPERDDAAATAAAAADDAADDSRSLGGEATSGRTVSFCLVFGGSGVDSFGAGFSFSRSPKMCVLRGVWSSSFDLMLRSSGVSMSFPAGVLAPDLDRSNADSLLTSLAAAGTGDIFPGDRDSSLIAGFSSLTSGVRRPSDLTGVEVLFSASGVRDFSLFFSAPCSESRSDPVVSRSLVELMSDESEHSDPSRFVSGVSADSAGSLGVRLPLPDGNLPSGSRGGVMGMGCPGGKTGNPGAARGG